MWAMSGSDLGQISPNIWTAPCVIVSISSTWNYNGKSLFMLLAIVDEKNCTTTFLSPRICFPCNWYLKIPIWKIHIFLNRIDNRSVKRLTVSPPPKESIHLSRSQILKSQGDSRKSRWSATIPVYLTLLRFEYSTWPKCILFSFGKTVIKMSPNA